MNHVIPSPNIPPRLRVSDNGRWLVDAGGAPVFLLADTAWGLARRLRREEIAFYLGARREQGFNAVTFVALGSNPDISEGVRDAYGHPPLALVNGKPDPTRPLVTPGRDPEVEGGYDFWDHVDTCVDLAAAEGLYVLLLPAWGSWVVGNYNGSDTSEVVFDVENAFVYGRFLGDRYKDRTHVIWMLGGDRAAVNGERDSRPVFRAMARGIAAGVSGKGDAGEEPAYGGTLMSYHPRKGAAQSGEWFHHDAWLAFNSIQEWPENQVVWITRDWERLPPRPTWVFEGRYENYHKNGYGPEQWGAWQVRQQAYQSVFAGGFGHTYGNERVFGFGTPGTLGPRDAPPAPGTWQEHLQDEGALQMRHLAALMASLTPEQFLDRIPDQELIDGDAGKAERLTSDRLTASRGGRGDFALVYSANGRSIPLRMERLAGPAMETLWFDPRTGAWQGEGEDAARTPAPASVPSGPGTAPHVFTPPRGPGDSNDWVLVLRLRNAD